MNDQYVRNVIEAALLAAGRPLASDELVGLFDERDGTLADEVRAAPCSRPSRWWPIASRSRAARSSRFAALR